MLNDRDAPFTTKLIAVFAQLLGRATTVVWGIPGVFLAIPIAAKLKVLGDQVPRMATLAELLGE